jgi:hypothetical protein
MEQETRLTLHEHDDDDDDDMHPSATELRSTQYINNQQDALQFL